MQEIEAKQDVITKALSSFGETANVD